MLDTLKSVPKTLVNRHIAITVKEAAANIWAANANVVHVARKEGMKVFAVALREVKTLRTRRIKAIKVGVKAANDKANKSWNAIERVIDTRVVPVLRKVSLVTPTKLGTKMVDKGLARISSGVAEITGSPKVVSQKAVVRKLATKKPVAKKLGTKATTAGRAKLVA